MQKIIQRLSDKLAGKKVFIIGGGASLKNFDFSILQGNTIIVLNSSFLDVPFADILIWSDESFANNFHNDIEKFSSDLKFYPRKNCLNLIEKNYKGFCGAYFLNKVSDFDLDFSHQLNVSGNNSGAIALSLCANFKAKSIYLLGFDMKRSLSKKTHYHSRNQLAVPDSVYSDLFIPCMESLAKQMSRLNIEVINFNSDTALKCFPIKSYAAIKDFI